MKTFLEVENKMGPIILAPVCQFIPPLPETNPNFRKSDTTEKRKRATPKKKFRPATPRVVMMHPPLLQAPPKPSSSASSGPVREDTPWSGTGKMSGNLCKDRNWLLFGHTKKMEDATIDTTKPPLKEEPKTEEQVTSRMEEKCCWGSDCPFANPKRKEGKTNSNRNPYQSHKPEDLIP